MDSDTTTTFSFDAEHTQLNPYCNDLACWCHSTSDYHEVVTQPLPGNSDATIAYSFFGVSPSLEVQAS